MRKRTYKIFDQGICNRRSCQVDHFPGRATWIGKTGLRTWDGSRGSASCIDGWDGTNSSRPSRVAPDGLSIGRRGQDTLWRLISELRAWQVPITSPKAHAVATASLKPIIQERKTKWEGDPDG